MERAEDAGARDHHVAGQAVQIDGLKEVVGKLDDLGPAWMAAGATSVSPAETPRCPMAPSFFSAWMVSVALAVLNEGLGAGVVEEKEMDALAAEAL